MSRTATVLLVDGDPGDLGTVSQWLAGADYRVLTAQDGREGLHLFLTRRPDVVLAEVLLPIMDGLDLCRRIRSVSRVPVVFLSILDAAKERAEGLACGADDYLAKPPAKTELLERMAAVLRRSGLRGAAQEVVVGGPVRIDEARHAVSVSGAGVDLTPSEFELLMILMERQDNVVSSLEFLSQVWGPGYQDRGLIKWHMARLRRKLERAGLPGGTIASIRGVGYVYHVTSSPR